MTSAASTSGSVSSVKEEPEDIEITLSSKASASTLPALSRHTPVTDNLLPSPSLIEALPTFNTGTAASSSGPSTYTVQAPATAAQGTAVQGIAGQSMKGPSTVWHGAAATSMPTFTGE